MTNISNILSRVLCIAGNVSIVPYENVRHDMLQDLTIWSGSDMYGYERAVKFGDENWKPIGEVMGIVFPTEMEELCYELKVICLALYTVGVAEGMDTLKWSGIVHGVRSLRILGRSFHLYGIDSLSSLKKMPRLRVINNIHKVISTLSLTERPSLSVALLSAINWLMYYSIWSAREADICKQYLEGVASHYLSFQRKKHPVIPTSILKQLISQIERELNEIGDILPVWANGQYLEIQNIKDGFYTVKQGRYYSNTGYSKSKSGIVGKMASLPGLVNVLVLAFTGMRSGESLAMRDDCVIERVEDGQKRYFVRTQLSKTTDGAQDLEWVCNEMTASAINLLVEANEIVREKAVVIVDKMGSEISDDYKNELQMGLDSRRLFGVGYSLLNCRFFRRSKRPNSGGLNIAASFKIAVTESDIRQLEKLGCNYKSISPSSSDRHQKYKPGDFFNFTPHQFRHTFAWFIIANRLGDLDDIRYQYKHLWESMTLIYSQRGYESITELLNIADAFDEGLTKMAVGELYEASLSGEIAGKGGEKFAKKVKEMLGKNYHSGSQPHFKDAKQLIEFVSKNSGNLRGLSHGYCTKDRDCKIKNVANPSHCIYCEGYIATPKHLPHWKVIRDSSQKKLDSIRQSPIEMQQRLEAYSMSLKINIEGADKIITSLTGKEAEKA
ncbi:MAG: hypothetical protein MI976_20115 [Pseudomonadales bacterium]|nr:hypothetical protein [Pseudomonadales bacterium]